ncbi:hypothetical protein NG742_03650 [Carnobacterium divergens]|uniref:hypothetical protein n=1 Tax=Carnobacterium divergens TaxID=2748 RepID=UPI000D225667|nr:hypothetical protein [Carnobacterium divergens]MCO6017465.1 hypothetical protein [Carnobacterium divergens]SPC41963.1 protein of unknown function [Carnobacterium divergens]
MFILNIITLIYIVWSVYTIIDLLQLIKEMKHNQDAEINVAYKQGFNDAIESVIKLIEK